MANICLSLLNCTVMCKWKFWLSCGEESPNTDRHTTCVLSATFKHRTLTLGMCHVHVPYV